MFIANYSIRVDRGAETKVFNFKGIPYSRERHIVVISVQHGNQTLFKFPRYVVPSAPSFENNKREHKTA
jgi:hypothetical protein